MGMCAATESTALLQSRFGSTVPAAPPASWWLALSITAPVKDAGVITNISEPSVSGYARIELPNDDATWDVVDGEASLIAGVSWTPTGTLAGVQPGFWALYESDVATVPTYAGQLDGTATFTTGTTVNVLSVVVPLLDA